MTKQCTLIDSSTLLIETDDTTLTGEMAPYRRIQITRDVAADMPERGEGVWNQGVVIAHNSADLRDTHSIDLDQHEGLKEAIAAAETAHYEADAREFDYEAHVIEHLTTHHPSVVFCEYKRHIGYSPSDKNYFWVLFDRALLNNPNEELNPAAIANTTWNEFDMWAQGDIYHYTTDQFDPSADNIEEGWVSTIKYPEGPFYGLKDLLDEIAGDYNINEADMPKEWEITIIDVW